MDSGAVWDNGKYDDNILDYHNRKPYTTRFVDGNYSEATKVELIHAMVTAEYLKKWYERVCKL